jgi:2',3'-cyclic-nucleotide 2'-phosphodiesterase (5'-nucleotidase family)
VDDAARSHVLVLDAGDSLVRDRSPALTSQGKSSVELMNLMGYDAMALGAGDLAILGVDVIRQRMEQARFPFLSANVVLTETGELLAKPYVLYEVEGHRIAVIGLTDEVLLLDAEIRDPLSSLQEVLAQLEGQVDIYVLLSHAGQERNQEIAKEVPEVDLIVSGGGQGYTPEVLRFEGSPPLVHADTASPGHAGRRVGVGRWWFDDGGHLVALDWASLALDPSIPDDPEMARWVAANP